MRYCYLGNTDNKILDYLNKYSKDYVHFADVYTLCLQSHLQSIHLLLSTFIPLLEELIGKSGSVFSYITSGFDVHYKSRGTSIFS